MRTAVCNAGAIALTFLIACSADSQVVNIWPGIAPGSESWTQKERTVENTPVGTVIFNVLTPTLTAYLPERTRGTGAGIIIAPGGACVALAIDVEGHSLARWLQERGIAAFVLKYRIMEKKQEGIPADINMDQACKYGIADGIQAVKVVRQHAAEWGLSPDRVGFMGFSAGAMVTSGALLQENGAARPSFAALIYGGPFGVMPAIPARLPPVFMAWAQDDTIALGPVVKFYEALKSAGHKPEVHIFSAGGHGFGTRKQGTSSDHWIEAFYYWLQAQGFARPQSLAGDQDSSTADSVRAFAATVAEDVTQKGPKAWRSHFSDSPGFFMASEGHLVFANGDDARRGIEKLISSIAHIELHWGEPMLVDALSPTLAVVAMPYREVRVDTAGHRVEEAGYFTGLAERGSSGWKFRNAHWSVSGTPSSVP